MRSKDQTIVLGYNYENREDLFAVGDRLGVVDFICPEDKIFLPKDMVLVDEINRLKKYELLVVPWGASTKEKMQELIKMGVAGLTTDYPQVLAKVVAEGIKQSA